MKEDIEILKGCWIMKTDHVLDEENVKLKKAIENIINHNIKLEEKNEKLIRKTIDYDKTLKKLQKDTIWKDTIKAKIECYKNYEGLEIFEKYNYKEIILVLEELLEEGE